MATKDSAPQIISRKEAKANGLKRYFTGEPCSKGHVAERYVGGARCVVCCAENRKRWGRKHPERVMAWAKRNPEKSRETNRRHYANNRARRINYSKQAKEKSPEHYAAYRADYNKKNKDKILANVRNRKARKRNAVGRHTAADLAAIFLAQNKRCCYCRAPLTGKRRHVDHIVPLIKGGTNDRKNLQITCQDCNLRKNAKDPAEFARELGFLI